MEKNQVLFLFIDGGMNASTYLFTLNDRDIRLVVVVAFAAID